MAFVLGSNTLEDPSEFLHPTIRIGAEDVASDGTPKLDIVAVKLKFILYWRFLLSSEFAIIDGLYAAAAPVDFSYPDDDGVQQTVSVVILELDPGGGRIMPTLYEGPTLTLREV